VASVRVTTTGTVNPVVLDDLGRKMFNHPTVDYELVGEYTTIELAESFDMQDAINAGEITVDFNGKNLLDVRDLAAEDPSFGGTSTVEGLNKGLVPDDGQLPSGRILSDYGTWVNPSTAGVKWTDSVAVDGPVSPQTAYITLASKVFAIPYTKDYYYTVSLIWQLQDVSKNAYFKLLIDNNLEFEIKRRPFDDDEEADLSKTYRIPLTAGNHTFTLQARRSGGNKDFDVTDILIKLEEA
jgi:hypothetical protein